MSDYADYLASYASVAAIVVVGMLVAAGMLGANRLFRPVVPDRAKLLTYESGVDPVGGAGRRATCATTCTPSST